MNACAPVSLFRFPRSVHTLPNLCLVGGSNGEGEENVKPHVVSTKPFIKHPPNHPFFVIPIIGIVLFSPPQRIKIPWCPPHEGSRGCGFRFCLASEYDLNLAIL